jgi:uncharacterized damage-inducible protein DinB
MSTRTFFAKTWTDEKPKFRKMIAALPGDRLDYRPHERSNSASGLAWQIAEELRILAETFDTGEMKWEPRDAPATVDGLVAACDRAAEALDSSVAALDDAKWGGEAKYYMNGQVFHTSTIEDTAWGFLFDLIHHRGQLSTYIRPMGGKVPGVYGPSGDEG